MILGEVENYTPFSHFAFEKMGPGKRFYDVIIVKAACALVPGTDRKGIVPHKDPAPIRLADEHYGEPEQTSLRYSGDTVLCKPGADVFITGHARPPSKFPNHWAAEIEIKGSAFTRKQRVRLLGERYWQWTLLKGWHLSEPRVCESVPLRYELAFGGRQYQRGESVEHLDNPVGVGLAGEDRMDRDQRYLAPQIELFEAPTRKPGKVTRVPGLGPIPRFWSARKRYAGTYDAAWQAQFETQDIPDYPADFDLRFFQAAHADWTSDAPLNGGEEVSLIGLTGDAQIIGKLPAWRVETLLVAQPNARLTVAPMRLDTVEIDLDAGQLYLTWRLSVPHALQIHHAVLRLLPPEKT